MGEELELEAINKLFLELSQFATAKTKREADLESLLGAARAWARELRHAAELPSDRLTALWAQFDELEPTWPA